MTYKEAQYVLTHRAEYPADMVAWAQEIVDSYERQARSDWQGWARGVLDQTAVRGRPVHHGDESF